MPYLTEAQLAKRHSVPIALPMTLIKKNDWIIINTIRLSSTMKFSFRYLQLQLAEVIVDGATSSDICDIPPVQQINPSNGLAYVGIYKNYSVNTDPRNLPFTGSNTDFVIISAPGIVARDITQPALELTELANFTFIVVNNTSNADMKLSINGEVLITL
jgi:hypothetical protein